MHYGGQTYYIDIAFPGLRLAIEIDGYEFHHTRDAFTTDRLRHNALVLAGWKVLRFSAATVAGQEQVFVESVREAIAIQKRLRAA